MEQKRVPLLPATSAKAKPKKEPKTYCFELEVGESNERTYSSFSWLDLVQDTEAKETKMKLESGVTLLNPYASDDEDDLKAMAERFEAKYSGSSGKKEKRKRQAEDFIDKGAGYDEADSFIDNSDIYDEVVPIDLQPAHGGFYINSGALDFKQVEVSEDEDESSVTMGDGEHSNKVKSTSPNNGINEQVSRTNKESDVNKKVGRPPSDSIRPMLVQKRRASNSSSGSSINKPGPKRAKTVDNSQDRRTKTHSDGPKQQSANSVQTGLNSQTNRSGSPSINPKKRVATISITSTSDESSDSSDDSSSNSEESSEESPGSRSETAVVEKHPSKNIAQVHKIKKSLPALHPIPITKNINSAMSATNVRSKKVGLPPKRLKVKNVPLNPKLHGNGNSSTSTPPNSNTPRQPVPSTSPLSLNINQTTQLKPPPPLSQQISPNSVLNSDLFISKVPAKDGQTNLLKLPTLTPAPSISHASPNSVKPKPSLKKLTNRMSCGPSRGLPKPQMQNMKERKSDSNLLVAQSSFQLSTSAGKSTKSVITPNSPFNVLNHKPSSSTSAPAQNKHSNSSGKPQNTIVVTQKTFNKIRKPKQKSPEKRFPASSVSDYIREADLRLNPKHATSTSLLTTVTSAQILQQMMLAAGVSSSSYTQYSRQSPVNTTASSLNVAALIPSSKSKAGSSTCTSEVKNRSRSQPATSSRPSSVILKINSGQKNASTPPPPPMQYANLTSLPSSLTVTQSSSTTTSAGNNSLKQQQRQEYGKPFTAYDVSALLSNRKP